MEWAHLAPVLVTVGFAMAGILFVRRYGGGAAMAELERSGRILEKRVHDLERENATQAAELVTLRAETNVALAVAPVLAALQAHERRAERRSDGMLLVLERIAEKLGPEAEAA